MKFSSLIAAASLTIASAVPALASPLGTINGQLGNLYVGGYGGPLAITSTTAPATYGTLYAFCIDGLGGEVYPSDKTHAFNAFTSVSEVDTLRGRDPVRAAKVTGLMNYVVDNYFADFLAGKYAKPDSRGMRSDGYLFNQALWELTQDYGRSNLALDVDATSATRGNFYYALGDGDKNNLLTTVVADLNKNFNAISASYRSTKYDVFFLDVDPATYDPSTNYQSLLAIAARNTANEVPEPSTLALLLAAGGVGLARRRARAKA